MPLINYTLNKKRLRTFYGLNGGPGVALWDVDDAQIVTQSRNKIGESKAIILDLTLNRGVAGLNFYINPALFVPNGYINPLTNEGTNYYSCYVPVNTPNNYVMAYTGTGFNPVQGMNFGPMELTVITSTRIQISIPYYQTYDEGGYLNPSMDDNSFRFLKDHISNPSTEQVGPILSVYNDPNMDARVWVYAKDNANIWMGGIEVSLGGYPAGFYGKNELQMAPYFSNPIWEFSYLGNAVPNLKTIGITDVTFKINAPAAPTGLMMWLIRIDNINPATDFVSAHEADFQNIAAANVTGGAKIIAPMTDWVSLGGGQYKATFRVDSSTLTSYAKYRFIAICYNDTAIGTLTSMRSNSFISDIIRPDASVPWNGDGIDFAGILSDVQTDYTGNNLTCVIEERMRSKLKLDYLYGKFSSDILNRLGLSITNDIRRYLTKVSFTIYEEDTIFGSPVKHVYDERSMLQTSPGTFSGTGITMNFGTENAEFIAEWRNRFDNSTANIKTFIGGVQYPGATTQYWGGKNMKIDWVLEFYYDDYFEPFGDTLTYTQKMTVKDYSNIIAISAQNPALDGKDFLCTQDEPCLKAVIRLENMRLIVNIDTEPGGLSTIEEAENWVPPILIQETTPKIYNEETSYGQTIPWTAKWCIDPSLLTAGQTYRISAIAKPH